MELWTNLPGWIRYTIAIALVACGIAIFCFADRVPVYRVGALIGGGFALMLIGPTDSDKQGYKF